MQWQLLSVLGEDQQTDYGAPKRNKSGGAFGMDEYSENLVFAYYGANSTLLFRQWVADGKKLSLEELIDVATKLICHGMSSVVKKK